MEEVLRRCAKCGIGRRWLHRHHIIPKSQGGSNDSSNILQLCANCHEDEHGGRFGGAVGGNRTAHTPQAEAKRSATMLELWKDPDFRARHLKGLREGQAKVDQKTKGERIRAAWTPERRAAHAQHLSEIRKTRFWASVGPNVNPDMPSKRWSTDAKQCIVCGTTQTPHRGRGLCITCYLRLLKRQEHAENQKAKRSSENDIQEQLANSSLRVKSTTRLEREALVKKAKVRPSE